MTASSFLIMFTALILGIGLYLSFPSSASAQEELETLQDGDDVYYIEDLNQGLRRQLEGTLQAIDELHPEDNTPTSYPKMQTATPKAKKNEKQTTPLPNEKAVFYKQDSFDTKLKMTIPKVKVSKIIDGRTIMLETGDIVELTGLYFSYNERGESAQLQSSYDFLNEHFKGYFVRVHQTIKEHTGRNNRYGHLLAHIQREDGVWAQGSLIASGYARVLMPPTNPEMAEELYTIEGQARKGKLGIWADPKWRILSAEESKSKMNSFQIIEGSIKKTAMRNNKIYLNFGDDWRTDFTVMIPQEHRVLFSRLGHSPLNWLHKKVRIRGWVQDFNGPLISAEHPLQFEFLDE